MKAEIEWHDGTLHVDFARPRFLSIPLDPSRPQPRFFAEGPATAEALRSGSFVGRMDQGASCNAQVIEFSPHSHGTHTECIGHIRPSNDAVIHTIDPGPCLMRLMTVSPVQVEGRLEISEKALGGVTDFEGTALALRTLPNEASKQWRDYDRNPEYPVPSAGAMKLLSASHLMHLLLDGPSLDRSDSRSLDNHAAWWGLCPDVPCGVGDPIHRSVTEMIYVPDDIPDGEYWLHLELAPIVCDAVPSRPVIYPVERLRGDAT